MLSRARIPSSAVASTLRAFALLAITALGACNPVGVLPGDCSYEPSSCPSLAVAWFCTAAGACTVDGAPAECDQSSCSLAPGQKLTVQLEGSKVTAATPDLILHFTSVTPAPEEVHVLIDGVEIAGEKQLGSEDIQVTWKSSAPSPKTLELSFSKGTEATKVDVSFQNLECEIDDQASCHGGGN